MATSRIHYATPANVGVDGGLPENGSGRCVKSDVTGAETVAVNVTVSPKLAVFNGSPFWAADTLELPILPIANLVKFGTLAASKCPGGLH